MAQAMPTVVPGVAAAWGEGYRIEVRACVDFLHVAEWIVAPEVTASREGGLHLSPTGITEPVCHAFDLHAGLIACEMSQLILASAGALVARCLPDEQVRCVSEPSPSRLSRGLTHALDPWECLPGVEAPFAHSRVIDRSWHWHREVPPFDPAGDERSELLTAEPQESELRRVALPDVVDEIEPEVVWVSEGFFHLPDLKPHVVAPRRATGRLDLDDPLTAHEVTGRTLASSVVREPPFEGLLSDDEGQCGVFDLAVGSWGLRGHHGVVALGHRQQPCTGSPVTTTTRRQRPRGRGS
jgi:hypothetical protein